MATVPHSLSIRATTIVVHRNNTAMVDIHLKVNSLLNPATAINNLPPNSLRISTMALRLRNSMLANIAKHHLSLATHQDPDKALKCLHNRMVPSVLDLEAHHLLRQVCSTLAQVRLRAMHFSIPIVPDAGRHS